MVAVLVEGGGVLIAVDETVLAAMVPPGMKTQPVLVVNAPDSPLVQRAVYVWLHNRFPHTDEARKEIADLLVRNGVRAPWVDVAVAEAEEIVRVLRPVEAYAHARLLVQQYGRDNRARVIRELRLAIPGLDLQTAVNVVNDVYSGH